MSKSLLLWIGAYVVIVVSMFAVHQAALGTALVFLTAVHLASLIVTERKADSNKRFWAGLAGLAWFAVVLGFSWEVTGQSLADASQKPLLRAHEQLVWWGYIPFTRIVATGGIFEVRTLLDFHFKNYQQVHIPSLTNFSRLFASLSAWMVAGCVGAILGWRQRKKTGRTVASNCGAIH